MNSLIVNYLVPNQHSQRGLVLGFVLLTLGAIFGAIATETWVLMGLPLALLVLWVLVVDYKSLYWLLLASLPLSTEAELPGGFGTDLPSEPLMWLLTLASTLWLIRHGSRIDGRFFRHPISLFLLVHLFWMLVTVVGSEDFGVSLKFYLAKGWYVITFYLLAGRVFQDEKDFKRLVWWVFVPLVFTVVTVLVRHAKFGFSFEESNHVLSPFYRNHVMYACLLAVFLPFVWYGTYWYKRWSWPWWVLVVGIVLILVGINFAFTRAAYGALVAAVGLYWLARWRAVKAALVGAVVLLGLFIGFVTYGDNWLLFAPDYNRTITHTRFENLLEATTRLEDISVMERVYRWVAASQMIQDKPWLGFGPGNFYFFYKNYTVVSFKTYVSDNPERSGMHNYYLMTAVEQGLLGAFIFIGLCFFAIAQGQRIFHQTPPGWRRRMLVAALMCFSLIVMLMLMNDFVETDKIGSLFFISLAILVNTDLQNRKTENTN